MSLVETQDSVEQAMAEERARASKWILWARVAWTLVTLAWCVASGYLAARPSAAMRVVVPFAVLHFVFALVLVGANRFVDPKGQRSWLAILGLDFPMVFLGQYFALEASSSPLGRADSVGRQFILLLIVSQLAMRRRHIFQVALVAAVMQLVLVWHASAYSLGPRLILTPLLLGVTALVTAYLPSRLRALVQRAVDREQLAARLRRYFSTEVARQIESAPTGDMRGASRELTVLVVDIRDFTKLSSRLEAPAVVAVLNDYLGAMVQVVFARGGTLDKFVGDGLIAYFGAPLAVSDHAARAVACAVELQERVSAMSASREREGLPTVRIGVGINSGTAVVGDVGAPERREYTIIGDAVNVAARTEGLTKLLGVDTLCTAATREQAGDAFEWTAMEPQQVKGKEALLHTFVPRVRARGQRSHGTRAG